MTPTNPHKFKRHHSAENAEDLRTEAPALDRSHARARFLLWSRTEIVGEAALEQEDLSLFAETSNTRPPFCPLQAGHMCAKYQDVFRGNRFPRLPRIQNREVRSPRAECAHYDSTPELKNPALLRPRTREVLVVRQDGAGYAYV